MEITPTSYLEYHLNPISKAIDSFGGPHVLIGLIASGGQPHMVITGNVKGNLRKEMFEALADNLRKAASMTDGVPSLVTVDGAPI